MRVAFFQEGLPRWIAGFTYLPNLLSALRLTENPIECFILLRPGQKYSTTFSDSSGFVNNNILGWPKGRPKLKHYISKLSTEMIGRSIPDKTLNNYLNKHKIDAVFGSYWQYNGQYIFPTMVICSWIHDFQFVHFPELYDKAELPLNHQEVNRMIKISNRVVVSSQTVLGDLLNYAPWVENKSRIMRFVATVPSSTYEHSPAKIIDFYNLPLKFIYLPNQFWNHKNHSLLLEALRILKKKQVFPKVVCTGQTFDYKDPYHYAEIVRKVAEYNLHNQIFILGIIPIEHVRNLIRQSIGVLNPSLCEGWSSTVEEAKSIGKRVILSDLPVHREQKPSSSLYFNPRDAEDLASKIESAWNEWPYGPDQVMEAEARNALPGRMSEFGRTFLTILEEAIQNKKGLIKA
jgi:glycosyltransferase involved in cell wall biosynthesis